MTTALLKQAQEALEECMSALVHGVCEKTGRPTFKSVSDMLAHTFAFNAVSDITAFTTLSEYDKAIHAIASILDGEGWFAWCPVHGPKFFYTAPFIQEEDEVWIPHWRSHGEECEISEPFKIPAPENWRDSLRRVTRIDGQLVVTKG